MEKFQKTHGDKLTIFPPVKVDTVNEDEDYDSIFIPYEDNQTLPRSMPPQELTDANSDFIDLDNITDQIIGMEVVFDQGEARHQATGKIINRCVYGNGRPIGTLHQNLSYNQQEWEYHFP